MKSKLVIVFILIATGSYCQVIEGIVKMHALSDFPVLTREGKASNRKPYGPFHAEKALNALAGDDLNYTFQMAAAEGTFPGKAGEYTICLNTLTERDGECVYNVYVNGKRTGLFKRNPPTNEFTAPATLIWQNVEIPANASIRVESNNWSNLERHEDNFYEYARGRWIGIDFIPENGRTKPLFNGDIGVFQKSDQMATSKESEDIIYNDIEKAYYLTIPGAGKSGKLPGSEFIRKIAEGDFQLEALVTLIGNSENSEFKGGLMIRKSTGRDSPYISCLLTGKDHGVIQIKENPESKIREIHFSYTESEMMEFVRKNNQLIISTARLGDEYSRNIINLKGSFRGELLTGLYTEPGNGNSGGTARFSKVRFYHAMPLND